MFRWKSSKNTADGKLAGRGSPAAGITAEDTTSPPHPTLPEATEDDRQLVLATQAVIEAGVSGKDGQCAESLGTTLRACSNANNVEESVWDFGCSKIVDDPDAGLDCPPEIQVNSNESASYTDIVIHQLSIPPARRQPRSSPQELEPPRWTLRRRVRSLLRFFVRAGRGDSEDIGIRNNHAGGKGVKRICKPCKKRGKGKCKNKRGRGNKSPPSNASNMDEAPPPGQPAATPNEGGEETDRKTAAADGGEEGPATEDKTTAASRGKEPGAQAKQKQQSSQKQKRQQQQQEDKPEASPEPTPEAEEETPLTKPELERLLVLRGGPTTELHRRKQEDIFRECRVIPVATLYKKVALVPGRERLFLSAPSNPRTLGSHMLYDIAYENYRHHSDCNRDFTRVGLKNICSNYCRPSQFRYVY